MYGNATNHFAKSENEILGRIPDVQVFESPITFQAVVCDLDGTLMASYKTLLAIDRAHKSLMAHASLSSDDADKFIKEYLTDYSFQMLLHRPEKTLEALDRFTKDKGITLPPEASAAILEAQKAAFTAYEGVKETFLAAKAAGVPVFIYTNSPDAFAVGRLITAGFDPEKHGIVGMWSKADEKYQPLSWLNEDSTALEKRWAQTVIPYTYKKPNDTPLREISLHGYIDPQKILFIGEGTKDVESAFCDINNPAAAFCLQVQGARDIKAEEQIMNERLRPGAEPLGLAAVEKSIQDLGVTSTAILRLDQGFTQLNRWISSGAIRFEAPMRMPYVRSHQLSSDQPVEPGLVHRARGHMAHQARPGANDGF